MAGPLTRFVFCYGGSRASPDTGQQFVVGKIPMLDSVWDVVHTAVRPVVGGAVGVVMAQHAQANSGATIAAAALGGGAALASHVVKTSTRVGVNASPEPVSNIVASLLEDLGVAGLVSFAVFHPAAAATVAAVVLAAGLALVALLASRIRRTWRRRRDARLRRSGDRTAGGGLSPQRQDVTLPPARNGGRAAASRFVGQVHAAAEAGRCDGNVAGCRRDDQDEIMTNGSAPGEGDGSPEPDTRLELRVSHADRDRVVETLTAAASEGLLAADELDDRVESALSARTRGELAVLTADLPPSGIERHAKELIRIDQRFGDVTRAGQWVVPRRMEIKLTAGDVTLDFTRALIIRDTVRIDVDLGLGGDLTLVTRPGVVVDTDGLTGRLADVKVSPAVDPHVPVILRVELVGRVRGGGVVVRFPRRTFLQWLLRKPRPYQPQR